MSLCGTRLHRFGSVTNTFGLQAIQNLVPLWRKCMIKKTVAALLAVFALNCWAAVDVNTATAADLDSIKGIGPGTSGKMLDARKASPFKNWSDLVERVPGIGDKRAGKLSAEGLTVNGEAYKAGSTASAAEKKPTKTTK